jgi:hypothetical protein
VSAGRIRSFLALVLGTACAMPSALAFICTFLAWALS